MNLNLHSIRLILPILLICVCVTSSLGQWTQTNGPKGSETFDIQEVDNGIWAATEAGLYISNDQGDSWNHVSTLPANGSVLKILTEGDVIALLVSVPQVSSDDWDFYLYRSADQGLSWTSNSLPNNSFWKDDPDLLRVDSSYFFKLGSKFYRSDDFGLSWDEIITTSIISRVASNGEHLIVSSFHLSYISGNKGDSWSLLDSVGTQTILYLEDSLIIVETLFDSMLVSEDLGLNWIKVRSPGQNYGTSIRRGKSGRLYYLGSEVFVSTDNGFSWSPIETTSPINSRVNDVFELINGEYLFSSNRGIFISSDLDTCWVRSVDGIIGSEVVSMIELPNGDIMSRSNVGDFRSANGGYNWLPIDKSFRPLTYRSIVQKGDSLFISHSNSTILLSTDNLITVDSFASKPVNNFRHFKLINGKFFILGRYSYFSDDLKNWTAFEIEDPNISVGEIDDIISTKDGAWLAVTDRGNVFKSLNGEDWIFVLEFSAPGVTDNYLYEIDGFIFLVDNNDWFRSDDNGWTWSNPKMSGLPDGALPVRLAITNNIIYVAHPSQGVFFSSDAGDTWQDISNGMGSLRCHSIIVANDQVFVGTAACGIWRNGSNIESQTGTVYNDLNNNGSRDSLEGPVQGVLLISNPLNTYTTTNTLGSYTIYTSGTEDTLSIIPPSPYCVVHPNRHIVSQAASDYNFDIHFIPDKNDLAVSLTSVEQFRPGFDNRIIITTNNIGTTEKEPIVQLVLDDRLEFIEAVPAPSRIDLDTMVWDLPVLSPRNNSNIMVRVNLDPSVSIGDYVFNMARVLPKDEDENPANNDELNTSEVVGAFDPNDKQVEPDGPYTPEQLSRGDELIYTVRFQNTGNYPAQHVRVIDTLSNHLDVSSINLLSTSHSMEWRVHGSNVVEFVFENILLPDSTSNEPASHGFIKFGIKPKSDLNLGDEIFNYVDIYFDFNESVRTNTAYTIYDENTEVAPLNKIVKSLTIRPNPAIDYCQLSIENYEADEGHLHILDGSGKMVRQLSLTLDKESALIALHGLTPGFYTCNFHNGDNLYVGSLIIQK